MSAVRAGGSGAWIIRMLDILFSMVGLMLVVPFFPIIAILIKLESRGPIVYPVERIGKGRKPFKMYKFRTMLESAEKIELSVCPQHDPRVTAVGRFLRRTKLNEFPQIFNVLKGDMSFVGPRPEAPDLAEMYPEEAKEVLSAKPGLVGPAVISSFHGDISGRNEEELYPIGTDPKQYYIHHILPEKAKIDLLYLSQRSVANYFKIIFLALKETVFGAFRARKAEESRRQLYLLMADLALAQISYAFGFLLFRRLTGIAIPLQGFLLGLILVLAIRPLLHYALGLYNLVFELVTRSDVFRVLQAVGLGTFVMLGIDKALSLSAYPLLLALTDTLALGLMLVGVRLSLMIRFLPRNRNIPEEPRPRAVIFGANQQGLRALRALGGTRKGPYKIIGFIDDSEESIGKKLNCLKILGNRHHLKALSVLYDIEEMILAPEREAGFDRLDEIISLGVRAGIRNRVFSHGWDEDASGPLPYPLRPVHQSDILPHVPVHLDPKPLRSLLAGKTVLMVGSGGQLGSALCRKIYLNGGRKIVILERYGPLLGEITSELRSDHPDLQIVPAVADCQDLEGLNKVFARHQPHIVVHAGMRKFINLSGIDYDDVARANYFRTFNLAKAASAHGCQQFLVISSIKATAHGNFVSDSLRVAEISLSTFFNQTHTNLIIVRVGNIIENRGGIVSWMNDQIVGLRRLSLPPEASKIFLISKHAASKAILQALVTGSSLHPGGFLLTSEPGALLTLAEVAARIANLNGLELGEDIAVRYGEIPGGLIDDKPGVESPQTLLSGLFNSFWAFPMFEKLVTGKAVMMPVRDLHQETSEFIARFDDLGVSSRRTLDSN